MKYKTPTCLFQLVASPMKLREVVKYFEELSKEMEIEPTISRVWDPVSGDSGVHEAHRAVDIRDEIKLSSTHSQLTYTNAQVDKIVKAINEKYPRHDGKVVCMHHSFKGGPLHFHIQIPASWA